MLKYAVIGDPVAHSLSPAMQGAAFRAAGIAAEYSAVHVRHEELKALADRARAELSGFNITVPHKNAIIEFLDGISPDCARSKSVNTVSVKNGRLFGESTDGHGLEASLSEEFGAAVPGGVFCFIGCGGAAQAAAFHFAARGAKAVFFINRTLSKAQDMVRALAAAYSGTLFDCCQSADIGRIKDFISRADVVIQASSLGLKESDPTPLDPDLLPAGKCFYDTIYKNTALLKEARARGLRCADGRGMLLHQGARSFSIWTGVPAPLEVMRKTLYNAIDARNNAPKGNP
jgi:shikimate dehydrogenase